MITLKINGEEVTVEKGTTVLEAALQAGIEIPHFCFHPALRKVGSCRVCQVEFIAPGRPRLDVSCRTVAADGMEVETHSEAALRARAGVLEFLLTNHPVDCPICDKAGECPLQNYTYECGFTHSRFQEEKRTGKKRKRLGGHIIYDEERCVLCTRCVRFMKEYLGDPQLTVTGRGDTSKIDLFPGGELHGNYTGNLDDVCPVGALTLEDFRFKVRAWYLKSIPSVCPYCSRGCNIHLDVRERQNRLFRVRPRPNAAVNEYFICNEGRFRPLEAAGAKGNRLEHCYVDGEKTDYHTAVQRTAEGLKQLDGKILIVASARRTVEELFLISKAFKPLEGARLVAAEPDQEEPDGILRTGECAPNLWALKILGYEVLTLDALADAMEDSETKGLVMLDAAINLDPGIRENLRFILYMDYIASGVAELADAALPGLAWFEKSGTFINHEGRVQRIRPALNPPAQGVQDDIITLSSLGRLLHGEDWPAMAPKVFEMLAAEHPVFEGLDYPALGDDGAPLKSEGGDGND